MEDISRYKHYVIKGDPVALARVRFSRVGGIYDSQKHIKVVWGIDLQRQHNEEPFFSGPLFMDVIFYFPIPKNCSRKRAKELAGQYHISKPDSSNLLKFVEDVATKILYNDDCIIAYHCVEKLYDDGNGPRTEFVLRELVNKRPKRELA
jgi:Holliday junction resolvase RusA-like endonuclease